MNAGLCNLDNSPAENNKRNLIKVFKLLIKQLKMNKMEITELSSG